jgi:hypothetical protein
MTHGGVDGLQNMLLAFQHVVFDPAGDILDEKRNSFFVVLRKRLALELVELPVCLVAFIHEELFVFELTWFHFQNVFKREGFV